MLNSGKKFRASRYKIFFILTLVLSEKKILNETKNDNPPPPPYRLNSRFLNDWTIDTTFVFNLLYSCLKHSLNKYLRNRMVNQEWTFQSHCRQWTHKTTKNNTK